MKPKRKWFKSAGAIIVLAGGEYLLPPINILPFGKTGEITVFK